MDELQHRFLVALQNALIGVVEGVHELLRRKSDEAQHCDDAENNRDDGVTFKIESTENHAENGNDDKEKCDAGVQDASDGLGIALNESLSGSLIGSAHAFAQ